MHYPGDRTRNPLGLDWYLKKKAALSLISEGADAQIFAWTSFIACKKVGTYFTAFGIALSSLHS